MSTKTGFALASTIAETVGIAVFGTVITSSPSPTFNDFNEDLYHVKIEIKNEGNHLNQIFGNNEWYPQNRWVYNATNISETNNSTFKLNISEDFEGSADLIVKIKSQSFTEIQSIGYTIDISMPPENQNTDPDPDTGSESQIYFEFEWDEYEIINTKKFDIDVDGFNLDDEKYDVKIWIENDDDVIISEIYDENDDSDDEEDRWQSGLYYVNDILSGEGDDSDKAELRLKEDYDDFIGDANIFIKIRDEDGDIIFEEDKSIDILENEDEEPEEDENSEDDETALMERAMALRKEMSEQNSSVTGQVIRLGSKINDGDKKTEDIKSKNSIIYESSTEKIKKYSVFGFAFLCMMLSVLLIKEKL